MRRPPVNSTPRLSPRVKMPASATTSGRAAIPSQRRPRFIRSGYAAVSQVRTRPSRPIPLMPGRLRTKFRRRPHSASTRATISADTMEARTPIDSVTPKPLTGPEARKNNSPAASRVVTLESMIARPRLVEAAGARGCRPAWGRGVLLPRSFEDEHVRVDRHADREHEPGESRQRQRRAEGDEHGVGQQGVRRQRDRGQQADQAVDEDDEQAGERETDDAAFDGVDAPRSQRRADECAAR